MDIVRAASVAADRIDHIDDAVRQTRSILRGSQTATSRTPLEVLFDLKKSLENPQPPRIASQPIVNFLEICAWISNVAIACNITLALRIFMTLLDRHSDDQHTTEGQRQSLRDLLEAAYFEFKGSSLTEDAYPKIRAYVIECWPSVGVSEALEWIEPEEFEELRGDLIMYEE